MILTLLLVIGLILLVVWILGLVINFITGPILWVILAIAAIFLIIWLVRAVSRRA